MQGGEESVGITQETRREAYESVEISAMESKVLDMLMKHGPQIAEEIMERLGTSNPNNVRPRLTGLKKKGLARPVDKRPNRNGRNEAVWEAIPDAEQKESRPGGNDTEGGYRENIPDSNIADRSGDVNA